MKQNLITSFGVSAAKHSMVEKWISTIMATVVILIIFEFIFQ